LNAYWEHLQTLAAAGRPFVAVTLVDVIASAPANAGAKMLVTEEGLSFGSVGGGKMEMKAIAEAKAILMQEPTLESQNQAGATHRFVEWNLQRDVGMTCGGAVRLFFEAYNVVAWPIVIFGAGHCSQALVRLLLTLQCHVTVIDQREEWVGKMPAGVPASKLRVIHATRPLQEYVRELPANAFVLMMTMGHATDQPILVEILNTRLNDFPYIGVIGSEAKAAVLRRGVLAAGVPEPLLERYTCPIGLPLGTNDPAEIAVSIAAQLLQRRDALSSAAERAKTSEDALAGH
jgi:xanthine dehydrogenase accessory factor